MWWVLEWQLPGGASFQTMETSWWWQGRQSFKAGSFPIWHMVLTAEEAIAYLVAQFCSESGPWNINLKVFLNPGCILESLEELINNIHIHAQRFWFNMSAVDSRINIHKSNPNACGTKLRLRTTDPETLSLALPTTNFITHLIPKCYSNFCLNCLEWIAFSVTGAWSMQCLGAKSSQSY